MKRFKKSVTVPTIIICTLSWGWFASKALETKEEPSSTVSITKSINDIEKLSIAYQLESSKKAFYAEYERLKEEERKRLAEIERQRLERLEKERLAKIEEQKRLEEKKKQQVVSRGSSDAVGGWRNAELTHFSAFCKEGCNGTSASGVYIGNSEYYKGYRVVASYKGIPLYTLLEVEYPSGEKFKAVVLDRGGAINHAGILDVLVSSDNKGNKLGRQNGRYRIIGSLNK